MKIFNKSIDKNSIEANNTKDSLNFCAKKIPITVMNPNNWKAYSTAAAALGMATLALNNTNNNDIEDLEKILSKQTVDWNSGIKQPAHTPEEIKLILELYKSNPKLVYQVVQMRDKFSSINEGPRFRAKDIEKLVKAAQINPNLVQKLLYKGTVYNDSVEEYSYNAETITSIVELAKEYPEFINKTIDINRTFSNGGYTPKYDSVYEFKALVDAYEKNPILTESLISEENIRAIDIRDFSKTFENIDFYLELKENFGEENLNEIKNIKNINRFTELIKGDLKGLDISDKSFMIAFYNVMPDKALKVYQKYFPDFDIKINQVKMALGFFKGNISTPFESQKLFVENFLSNNNPEIENILKTFDFAQFKKEGLPLKYSRKDFIEKIEQLIENLDKNEQNIILQHFGLMRGYEDIDGLLENKPFDKTSVSKEAKSAAKLIEEEIKLFTEQNEIITGQENVDKMLTGIIRGLPEFAFFIGKKQHDTHIYSVDIHTLKVLQSAMNHPLYEELSDSSKTVLKMSILLHDFGKKGNVKDPGHAALSRAYASGILKKFPFKEELNNRIIDTINNHHWFESYNLMQTKPHEIAALCRYPEELIIYQIFAKSDFENINDVFHIQNSDNVKNQTEFDEFMERKMAPIYEAFAKMRLSSNFVFDTRFLNNGEFFPREIVDVDGEKLELKVLNFNKLADGENLEKYGFLPGVSKEDARFIVHMTRLIEFYSTKKLVENISNRVSWSTSLVKNGNNNTVDKYGFIFNTDQANISVGYKDNLSLGHHRNFEDFVNALFPEETKDNFGFFEEKMKGKRTYLRDKFLECLRQKGIKLTKMEYILLAEYISSKKYITQFRQDFQVSDNKTIKNSDIIEALEYSRESLFEGEDHCEVECVNPIIAGLYAKASCIEMCDKNFLKFAKDNNLPIILMKNS